MRVSPADKTRALDWWRLGDNHEGVSVGTLIHKLNKSKFPSVPPNASLFNGYLELPHLDFGKRGVQDIKHKVCICLSDAERRSHPNDVAPQATFP